MPLSFRHWSCLCSDRWCQVAAKAGKVLVIDDDPDFVEYVRMALERAGYETLAAARGSTGLEIARRERPAVIIVDLLMGPQDGFTTCEQLRASPETQRSALLVVSAIEKKLHKTFASTDVGARLDVDGFLDKPVESEMLVKRVDEMLALARSRGCTSQEER